MFILESLVDWCQGLVDIVRGNGNESPWVSSLSRNELTITHHKHAQNAFTDRNHVLGRELFNDHPVRLLARVLLVRSTRLEDGVQALRQLNRALVFLPPPAFPFLGSLRSMLKRS